MIDFLIYTGTLSAIWAILTLSLTLQFGYGGIVNFSVVGFFMIGSYTSAALSTQPHSEISAFAVPYTLPVPITISIAILICILVGIGIAQFTRRVGGAYLGIITLGLAEIIHVVIVNQHSFSGGYHGILYVPKLLEGVLGNFFDPVYLIMCFVILGILYFLMTRAMHAPFGMIVRALSDHEDAVFILGRNADDYRIKCFVLGSALAGLAGGLFVHYLGSASPTQYIAAITFEIWAAMLVGGQRTLIGGIMGGILIAWMKGLSRLIPPIFGPTFVPALRFAIIGAIIIVVVRFFQGGISSWLTRRGILSKPPGTGE